MSVRFSAETDRYKATTGLPTGTAWTITCWVSPAVDRNANSTPWSTANTTTEDSATAASSLATDGTGTDALTYRDFNDDLSVGSPNLTVGTWYQVAVTKNADAVSYYWGVEGGSLTPITQGSGMAALTPAALWIGRSIWTGEWFNGRVAAFKMWNAELSSAQVAAELAQYVPSRTTNLLRWHPFVTAGTVDSSGNGSSLTAGSTATTTEDGPSIPWGTTTRPTYVADRGSVAAAAAATTTAVALTAPATITTGNYLIARVAVDNSGTNGAAPGCTVTDPRSNTWTVLGPALVDPGAAAAGATAYLAYAKVGTAYQTGDSLTFNWGGISTTAKAVVVEEWAGVHATSPVAVSAVTATGTGTAVSVAITPTAANQLVCTCLATEGIAGDTITYDADTTNGTWSPLTRVASADATATNNQCVAGQYKQVTAAGAQTWNATITSRDWAALAVVFAPSAVSATPTPPIRRLLPLLVR